LAKAHRGLQDSSDESLAGASVAVNPIVPNSYGFAVSRLTRWADAKGYPSSLATVKQSTYCP
jgi:hypothetical protein